MAEREQDNSGVISGADRAEIKRRVDDLDRKLDQVRSGDAKEKKIRSAASRGSGSRGMAQGMRMASELVAAIIVGGLLGFATDYFLGTKPWFFLVLFFVGFGAGVVNLLRSYKRMQAEMMAANGGDIGRAVASDDDE